MLRAVALLTTVTLPRRFSVSPVHFALEVRVIRCNKKPQIVGRTVTPKRNFAGISEEDGGMKCRDCMEDEDCKDLKQENSITVDHKRDVGEWIYCDEGKKRLCYREAALP